jgi:eukaryotic-like serine/threonine-protein kinase
MMPGTAPWLEPGIGGNGRWVTVTATLLGDRYTLDERIGAGGYCEVWRATDTVLARPVAVKLLHAGYALQPEAQARFKAEARHAGALSHKNIARVYDYGDPVRGQSYLVMELIDGPSLAELLAVGPLGAARTMDIVAQVAAGLQAAHGAGLIHRDIKPANILFAPAGTVRITDFGVAHAVGSAPVTATGMVMGTPGYIAPERLAGAEAGPASDLYALGIVAYECLAGSRPFSGSPLETAIAHRERPLPPLPASVPAEVVAFLMMLTAKDPAWRPAGAAEASDRAARLRDSLLAPGDGARPVRAGASPTAADALRSDTPAIARSGPRTRNGWPPRRWALGAAALAFAALACLVLVSLTGFASAGHPAAGPSATPPHAAPAAKPSPTASSPAATQPADQRPSTTPAAGVGGPAAAPPPPGHPTAQPGPHRHKKGRGHRGGPG